MDQEIRVSIHSSNELLKLKRKNCEDILKTILEQKKIIKGRKTIEEYLTRNLTEKRRYMLNNSEPIIFDQYPIYKYPLKSQRIDMIYAYQSEKNWKIGIVEAKSIEGNSYQKALEQANKYALELQILLENRKQVFEDLVRKIVGMNITLNDKFFVSRIDILAPQLWWKKNSQETQYQNDNLTIPIRHLSCNNDFLPKKNILNQIKIELM